MDSELPAAAPAAPLPGTWMRLELLGHRVRMGLVTEVEKFGARMARIDMFRTGDTNPCLTEYYAAGAFYAIGGTTEERARTWADDSWDIRHQLPADTLPALAHHAWDIDAAEAEAVETVAPATAQKASTTGEVGDGYYDFSPDSEAR